MKTTSSPHPPDTQSKAPAGRKLRGKCFAIPCAVLLSALLATQPAQATSDLLISNPATNSILRFDGATGAAKGHFVAPGTGGLNAPMQMVVGPDGLLYVADLVGDTVKRFSLVDGSFVDNFTPVGDLDAPISIKFGPDGDLYVLGAGNQRQIRRYSATTGNLVSIVVNTTSTRISSPKDFVFSLNGQSLLVVNAFRRISSFSLASGAWEGYFINPTGDINILNDPQTIILGTDGNYWISSRGNDCIAKFATSDGSYLGNLTCGSPLSNGPAEMILDGSNLFVTNISSNNVVKVDLANGNDKSIFVASGSQGLSTNTYMIKTFINDPPVAQALDLEAPLGTAVSGQLVFTDPDLSQQPQTLTAAILDTPTLGTLVAFDPATGSFTFEAGAVEGTEVLAWQVSDGALTTVGSLTLTVSRDFPLLRVEQAADPALTSGGPANDFQAVALGTGGLAKTFVLHNEGTVAIRLGSVAIGGADAADFPLDATGLAATIPPDGSTAFTVRFDPASAGTRHALLEIPSDAANTPLFTVALTGTGTTAGGALDLATATAGLNGPDAAPDAIPFPDGLPNLLKYAFNLDLAGPDRRTLAPGGDSGLPHLSAVFQDGLPYWRLEFVRRKASGLEYGLEASTTLLPGSFQPLDPETELPPATVTDIDDFWERVVLEEVIDPETAPRTFFRTVVRVP